MAKANGKRTRKWWWIGGVAILALGAGWAFRPKGAPEEDKNKTKTAKAKAKLAVLGTTCSGTFKLKLPVSIGSVVLKVSMARWSRTLSTLIASGVDIMRALEITAQTSGNWVVENETESLRLRVQDGASISQPLIDSDVFPPMVSQMVKIGEETGELEKMLSKVADFYEDEVDASIQALTSIVEPLMMVGVGCMVGVIIISMYLPMFKMLSLVK